MSPVSSLWLGILIVFVSTLLVVNPIGLTNNLSNSELYSIEIGAVVPIPTARLGITLILTISSSLRLCVVVFAAETLASNVVVTLSISPVTCSFCVWK